MLGTAKSVLAMVIVAVVASGGWAAVTTLEVVPAYAPVGPTLSPSWPGYVTNAIDALMGGTPATVRGTPDFDPAAYEAVTSQPISPRELVITPDFASWRGFAAPTPGWDGPSMQFAAENGNRVHFGLIIESDDDTTPFALDDLDWELNWLDLPAKTPSTQVDTPFKSGSFKDTMYSTSRVGVDYGPDGVLGGGDDSEITSGASTQLVDALYYVGIGDGFVAEDTGGGATDQADIDKIVDGLIVPQRLKVTYMLGDTKMAMGSVDILPEPGSFVIAIMAVLGGWSVIRRRRFA